MKTIRRTLAGAAVLGLLGLGTWTFANNGKLVPTEFKKLTAVAATPQDHQKLAAHFRAFAVEQEAEATEFDALAARYRTGLTGVTKGHAMELARGAKHYAEHARDSAEALRDLADVHDGIAEYMLGKEPK